MKNKITIAIPSHNNQDVISEAIKSAMDQEYPLKEILVIDDDSSDNTFEVAIKSIGYNNTPLRVKRNENNLGIGKNLEKLMTECKTRYIIYLCADDKFANNKVIGDIVNIFDKNDSIGVIGRYYYFFLHGYEGAIGVCRDKNILTQTCCPSGVALRKMEIVGTNKIFIEMPSIVNQYLKQWRWTMLEYDTIASRFQPGQNTGTKSSYYTESPTQNWIDLLGINYQDFPVFITLKNRAPHLLWSEIWLHVKKDNKVLLNLDFWVYAITAVVIPRYFLKKLSVYYRNRIGRKSAQIIRRPDER